MREKEGMKCKELCGKFFVEKSTRHKLGFISKCLKGICKITQAIYEHLFFCRIDKEEVITSGMTSCNVLIFSTKSECERVRQV